MNSSGSASADECDDAAKTVVGYWENRVFTTAVASAEDAGKPVALLALRNPDPYLAVLDAAICLQSTEVVFGPAERGLEWQLRQIRSDWNKVQKRSGGLSVEIVPDHKETSTKIDLSDDPNKSD